MSLKRKNNKQPSNGITGAGHIVLDGDTVASIANLYNIPIEDFMQYNSITDPNFDLSPYVGSTMALEDPNGGELEAATIIASRPTKRVSMPLRHTKTTSTTTPEYTNSAIKDFNNLLFGEQDKIKPTIASPGNTFGGVYAVALKKTGGLIKSLENGGNTKETPEIFQYIKGYVPKYFSRKKEEVIEEPQEVEQEQLSNEDFNKLDIDNKANYISNVLQNGGLEDWEAIGFTAVMYNESALNPEAENQMEKKKWTGDQEYKYGRGLCQWSLGRNDSFRDYYHNKYGNMVWASQASVDDQLEFALFERSQRDALLNRIDEIKQLYNSGKISKEQAAIYAADAYRRGFENGSKKSLASSKQMDAYTAVGSPGASAINLRDTRTVKKFLNNYV